MVKLQEFNYKPRETKYLLAEGQQLLAGITKFIGIEVEMELARKDTPLYKELVGSLINNQEFTDLALETNRRNAEHAFNALQGLENHLKATKFYAKRDGSLRDGIELVSHPFTLEWLEENQSKVKSMFRRCVQLGFNSYDTGTCGMHIHLSRTHFSGVMHLMRFYQFFQENAGFFHNMSRRTSESAYKYSFYINDSREHFFRNFANGEGRLDHHEAIELRHPHTIEVRIFRGTLNYDSLKAYIHLLTELVNYTRYEFYKRLSVDGFKNWIRKCKNTKPNNRALVLITKAMKKNPAKGISRNIFDNQKNTFSLNTHITQANNRYAPLSGVEEISWLFNKPHAYTKKYFIAGVPRNGIEVPNTQSRTTFALGWTSLHRTLMSLCGIELGTTVAAPQPLRTGDLGIAYVANRPESKTMFYPSTSIPVTDCEDLHNVVSYYRIQNFAPAEEAKYMLFQEWFCLVAIIRRDKIPPLRELLSVYRTYYKFGSEIIATLRIPELFKTNTGLAEFLQLQEVDYLLSKYTLLPGLSLAEKTKNVVSMFQKAAASGGVMVSLEKMTQWGTSYQLPMILKDAERNTRITHINKLEGNHLKMVDLNFEDVKRNWEDTFGRVYRIGAEVGGENR